MAESNSEFDCFMSRLREGNPKAIEELCERYGGHIRRAVRRKLEQRLRRQYDSIDFMQEVWASFIAVPPEDYTFVTPGQLVTYLTRMAANKVVDAMRDRAKSVRRDLARDVPGKAVAGKAIAPNPTPSQVAIADERWQQLLEGLTANQRQVVELLQQGHTHEEVAFLLNIHPKAIQRLIRKLAERIEP